MKELKIRHQIDFISENGNINSNKLFYNLFQVFPFILEIRHINGIEFAKELLNKHKKEVDYYLTENYFHPENKKDDEVDITIVFKTKEIIRANAVQLVYLYSKEELFSEAYLKEESNKYIFEFDVNAPRLRLFVRRKDGLGTESFNIEKVNIELEKNYNDDIQPFYDNLFLFLDNENAKGLHLLYGMPGTGKTNFLRHVISKVKRDVLFIPSGMTDLLADPTMFTLLTEYAGGILIIEDAEKAIISRESSKDNAVSTLLNISDGLLSDVLKMQIICTFNTDINNLDKALLRPGRLLTKYEFKELELNKAKKLASDLGIKRIISKPATLAELYFDSEPETIALQTRKAVGF